MTTAGAPSRAVLVVGHDGHAASRVVLKTAIDLAEKLDAQLHIVHSVTLDDYGIDPDIEAFEEDRDRAVAAERDLITATLGASSVPWSYHEQRGDPARGLSSFADRVDASFIIIGATHRGVLRHLTGSDSVSKRLLAQHRRPVLIVPV